MCATCSEGGAGSGSKRTCMYLGKKAITHVLALNTDTLAGDKIENNDGNMRWV